MNILEKINNKLNEAKELDTKEITAVKNSLDAIEEYLDDTRSLLDKRKIKGAQHSMKTLMNFAQNAMKDLSKIKN